MKSGKYIVIPCKPYVKQFLIQNFGYPVNFYSVANPYTYLFRKPDEADSRGSNRFACTDRHDTGRAPGQAGNHH